MPPASAKAAQPSAKSSKQSAAPVSAVAAGVLLSSRIAAEAAAAATFGTNWAVVLPSGYPTTIDAAIAAVECEADALRHALELAELRYASGVASYLDVLDAQRTLFSAELAFSQAQLQQLTSAVQLYKALGGSWR